MQKTSVHKQNIRSYKDLTVWQKAMKLAEQVYKISSKFPKDERYGLVMQIRRAVVSIPSNVAEGRSRSSRKDFVNFLHVALGSLNEVATQLELAQRLSFCTKNDYNECDVLITDVRRMLVVMIAKLKANS